MKMVKLTEEHYIVMDDSEIKEGDWIYNAEREPSILKCVGKGSLRGWQKITYSTQPLELICCTPVGQIKRYIDCKGCDRGTLGYNEVKPLPLSEVKELLGMVDVEKSMWYERNLQNPYPSDSPSNTGFNKGFELGYNQALEDNKEKKWTDADVIRIVEKSRQTGLTAEYLMLSLQLQTEWEVEMVDGKLKLKS